MIKKIIFDIDNTLIEFPKDYLKGYQSILDKYKVNKTAKDLYEVIGKYEYASSDYFSKEELLSFINKSFETNLSMAFLEDYLDMYNNLDISISQDIIDTLDYLSSKYELYTLSNWFTSSQDYRLNKVGILKYFTKTYGADIVPKKPNINSYMSISGNLVEECLIVGDNDKMDIEVPYEIGMKVYYLTNNKTKYPSIKNIKDLKEIL